MRCVQICDKVQSREHLGCGRHRLPHDGGRFRATAASRTRTARSAASASPTAPPARCASGTIPAKRSDALGDPNIVTVVQVAPAVRAAWGGGLRPVRRAVATHRPHGGRPAAAWASTMCSTPTSAADLTIMEEGSEFLERLHAQAERTAGPCSPPAARAGCAFSSRSIPS